MAFVKVKQIITTLAKQFVSQEQIDKWDAKVTNEGNTPSIITGLDALKPEPGTYGRLYIASDNQIIYQDYGDRWQPIGASSDLVAVIDKEEFVATTSQTDFNLSKPFIPNSNCVWVYVDGAKLPASAFTEVDNQNIVLITPLIGGEIVEVVHMNKVKMFPFHSYEHYADDGNDKIPVATESQDGLMSKEFVVKLNQTNIIYEFDIASSSWTVDHGLDRYPIVSVLNQDNEVIIPESIKYVDTNNILITFAGLDVAGKVLIS